MMGGVDGWARGARAWQWVDCARWDRWYFLRWRWWLDVAVVARVAVGGLCVALMLRLLGRAELVTLLAVLSRGRFPNHC